MSNQQGMISTQRVGSLPKTLWLYLQKKSMPKGNMTRHMCNLNQIYSGGKDETWIVAVTQSTLYVSANLNKLEVQYLPY